MDIQKSLHIQMRTLRDTIVAEVPEGITWFLRNSYPHTYYQTNIGTDQTRDVVGSYVWLTTNSTRWFLTCDSSIYLLVGTIVGRINVYRMSKH